MAERKRQRVQVHFKGESRTQQSFKKDCDIQNILKNVGRTGLLSHANTRPRRFEDLVGASDYHTALNSVIAANAAFSSLPAALRSRFANDPHKFLEFCDDPKNEAEMRELGLLKDSSAPAASGAPPGSPNDDDARARAKPAKSGKKSVKSLKKDDVIDEELYDD